MDHKLRVAQWATGNIGTHSLREVIRHPALELVGVLVYDPAKEGVDAGELCGLGPVGVSATTDKASIIALGADCVLYMPATTEIDDVIELLGSGANVVTTRGDLAAADHRHGTEAWRRIREACAQGGSSLYATGSSPGFITDALPFALLSLERRIDSIEIEEFANMSRRNSPEMLFDLMGFGRPPSGTDELRAQYLLGEFGPHLGVLATAAGRPIDEWEAEGSVALASEDLESAAGTLPAVTWIVGPQSLSEHATAHPAAGEDLTARLLLALKKYPDMYKSTVMLLNYDEGGQVGCEGAGRGA